MRRSSSKSLVVFGFLVSTFAIATFAQAHTLLRWQRDFYRDMRCAEVTPGGEFIVFVDHDRCRNQLGSRLEWRKDFYGDMRCAEVTPGGEFIVYVDTNRCR